MLKFAILAGTSAVYATFLDQIAASIILWVSALGAMSLFMRKWGRPVFRKYMRPQARLSEHMDKMEQGLADLTAGQEEFKKQQGAIRGELGAVKSDLSGIKVSSQAAREDARSALAVADAVRRKLGIPDDD